MVTDVYQKIEGHDNVFCLGRQCASPYWQYPGSRQQDSAGEAVEQAKVITANRSLNSRIYAPVPLDNIHLGESVVTTIGLVTEQERPVTTKAGEIRLFYRGDWMVGAATMDDYETIHRLRDRMKRGLRMDQEGLRETLT